jgi:ParB family chromosome partitioning protein
MRQVEQLDPNIIAIANRHRPLNSEGVDRLKESIGSVGLRTPITIRIVDGWEDGGEVFDGQPVLVTGRHRLEAVKALGWDTIECFIFDGDDEIDAELWEIAENLHRAELTAQERSDHIAEWIRLLEEKQEREREEQNQPSQVGTAEIGYKKPPPQSESGTNAAARELGISKTQAHRAKLIASIPDEVKQAAADAGLADNQSALERIAKASSPADELQVIVEERKARKAAREAKRKAEQKKHKESEKQRQAEKADEEFRALIEAWGKARPSVREKFRQFLADRAAA